MRLISIFTFLMSSMVMYRSNSDHNVVCRDIWFRIKRNLGLFLVTFRVNGNVRMAIKCVWL